MPRTSSSSRARYTIAGTNLSVGFVDVARAAYRIDNYPEDLEPGLEETAFYDPPGRATSSGIHLCVALVDPTDGTVGLRDYWSVDDVGRVVNPMVVEGQIQGGVAQGIGQAILEHCIFDEDGQLLTGSFLDYAVPRADDLPYIGTEFQETLCADNPLGAKGVGESGDHRRAGRGGQRGRGCAVRIWRPSHRHAADAGAGLESDPRRVQQYG